MAPCPPLSRPESEIFYVYWSLIQSYDGTNQNVRLIDQSRWIYHKHENGSMVAEGGRMNVLEDLTVINMGKEGWLGLWIYVKQDQDAAEASGSLSCGFSMQPPYHHCMLSSCCNHVLHLLRALVVHS